jgi:hypothetical protein
MYPSGELAQLANRKALLRARIAVARWECAAAGAELARGLGTVDRVVEQWRKISPWLKLLRGPLGLLAAGFVWKRLRRRPATPTSAPRARRSTFSTILKTLPLVLRGARMAMQMAAGGR